MHTFEGLERGSILCCKGVKLYLKIPDTNRSVRRSRMYMIHHQSRSNFPETSKDKEDIVFAHDNIG